MSALSLLLLALTAAPQSANPSCDSLTQALRGRTCVTAGSAGLAIAADPARAARLAELAAAGEATWRANYGAAPARYVVFESGTPPETARDRTSFVQAGFSAVVPVQPPAAWLAAQKRAIETQLRAQISALAGEQQVNDLIARVHTNLDSRNTPEANALREAASVPHDLGHQWFSAAFWPSERAGADHIGGPGPDWLDELAAQLAEPEVSATERRTSFRQIYSGVPSDITLAALLAGPSAGNVMRVSSQGPVGSGSRAPLPAGAQVISSASSSHAGVTRIGQAGGGAPRLSVSQPALARVFLDYLSAKSGARAAVPSLARAVANGGDLEQWLASDGAAFGLPTTQDALEAGWRAWIAETYPAPPA